MASKLAELPIGVASCLTAVLVSDLRTKSAMIVLLSLATRVEGKLEVKNDKDEPVFEMKEY
jgi:hypothetical protein